MGLRDIKTLRQISKEYNIPVSTLNTRLTLKSFNLIEGEDYIRQGNRMPILFSGIGVEKITKKL